MQDPPVEPDEKSPPDQQDPPGRQGPPATDSTEQTGAPRKTTRRRRLALLVGGAVLIPLVGLALLALTDRVPEDEKAGRCPTAARGTLFSGTTYGNGANVRSGARLDRPLLNTVAPDCAVGFIGFCVGEKVFDSTAGIPDARWFILPHGDGVVASAVIHGNPPSNIHPSECPDSHPAPSEISLKVAVIPEDPLSAALQVHGPHVQIVGFAAYYAEEPDSPSIRRWHQIGFTGEASPLFTVDWHPGQLRLPVEPGERVPVAAVACLGGGSPTHVAHIAVLHAPGPTAPAELTPLPTPLSAQDDENARQVACRYPIIS
ncbi:hypothetical protein [Parafrankia colletiae]|uniref:hypothetical protein n=1 Tax=Parafrankia colletiae TaxID=573497 RepID=UPI00104249A6|nr:hypothetical protein [Parafrankia colletiae]